MICRRFETKFKKMQANLLLDPERVPAAVRAHVEECPDCSRELKALTDTVRALDAWSDVTPSPFFEARMAARMHEARAQRPAGFWERLRARLIFGTDMRMRTLAAGALAVVLLIGGGTYAGVKSMHPASPEAASATVRDLQSLEENAQVFEEMSSLNEDDGATGGGPVMMGNN